MKFIRGDTFEFSGPVTLTINGSPTTDLTGWTARSQIRNAALHTLIDELDVEFLSYSPAVLNIAAPASTDAWPVGDAVMDVEFLDPGGRVVSTQKAMVQIDRDVTRPPVA